MTVLLRRRLGSSSLTVSPIGLGCWQFSKGRGMAGKFWPVLSDDEIANIVRVSLEGGINWFDTAEIYGRGESERALARSLKKAVDLPADILIATKWSPTFRTAKSILKTIDQRRSCLEGLHIDLYQIHKPYALSSISAQMKAMARLVKEQKIRFIGVSNFSANKMIEARGALAQFGLSLASNQVHYSLLNRRMETNGILDAAKKHRISIIAYSPLEQGLLSGKFHDNPGLVRQRPGFRKYLSRFRPEGLLRSMPVIRALRRIADKYEATPAQVALNWLIHFHGDVVVAIPGAVNIGQARENAGAMSFKLTADELKCLDDVSAPFKK
jgi:aryl-alcohol dehydrogenase-like predicted oxidoreductase